MNAGGTRPWWFEFYSLCLLREVTNKHAWPHFWGGVISCQLKTRLFVFFLRAFSQLLWTHRKTSKPLGFSVTVHKKNMLCSPLWRAFAGTHLKNMLRIIYLSFISLTAAHSDCTSADFSRKPDLSSPGVPHVMLCDWFSLLALQPELGSLLRALHAYHAIPTCASGCHCLTSFNPAAWPLLFSWATKTTRLFASAQHRQWQLVNRDLEAPFSL